MRVLLVGNRAIQHALAVRLEDEGCAVDVYPGQRFSGYRAVDAQAVASTEYDLIVMGSARYFDDPAIAELRRRGVPFFGADARAGQLETSKGIFKAFAASCEIPTPGGRRFSDYQEAVRHVDATPGPYVVKADGPARGCGVAICETPADAARDLRLKLEDRSSPYFAGDVVIEEFVPGFEVAVNIFLDEDSIVVLPPTKPHKRRNSFDLGPNVAGMGSRAPVALNAAFYDELQERIMTPTLAGLRSRGWSFRGCLFVNLMVCDDELVVLEFNCRMGDPAMLVDLLLLESGMTDLLLATTENRLASYSPAIKDGAAAAVTLVDPGYPDGPNHHEELTLDPDLWLKPGAASGLVNAGAEEMRSRPGTHAVTGGVVAAAVAVGPDFASARAEAYRLADMLPDLDRRSDIGAVIEPPARYASPAPGGVPASLQRAAAVDA